jgi:hypothetical protein
MKWDYLEPPKYLKWPDSTLKDNAKSAEQGIEKLVKCSNWYEACLA